MASPAIAQHRPTANAAAATSVSGTWSANTVAGDRLLAIVTFEANGISNVPITPADATWKLKSPPGRLVRQSAGVDELVVAVYEMINAPVRLSANAEVFNLGASVFATLELLRITGADLTTANALTPTSFVGNGLSIAVTNPGTPTVDSLAIFIASNGNPASTLTGPGGSWVLQDDIAPGTTGTDRERTDVWALPVAAGVAVGGATATVSGATNRNVVGLILVIPAPGAVSPGVNVVQSNHLSIETVAPTSVDIAWDQPTVLGNRLLLFVAENDNSSSTTVTVPAAWGSPIGPGKVTRQTSSLDTISGQVYEILNAAVRSGTEHITFSKGVYPFVAVMELEHSHLSTAIDQQSGSSGSSQLADTGATPITSITDGIAVAFVAVANTVTLSPVDTYTPQETGDSSGSGTQKITGGVYTNPITVAAIQRFRDTINGGVNHAWVAIVLAIPSSTQSGGGGGGGGGSTFFPNFDDGRLHRALTFDYRSSRSLVTLADAQAMAAKWDCCVATYDVNGGQYNDHLPDVLAIKPSFLAAFYNKSVQHTGDVGVLPDSYFAHTSGGALITTFSSAIHVMQPGDVANQNYNDPRGFTSTSFKVWSGLDHKYQMDHENARHAGTIKMVYGDSMGTSSYKGTQVSPTDGHAYSSADWLALVRGLGDQMKAAVGAGVCVLGNGLISGPNYQGASVPTKGLMDHVDMGLAENWIRNNFASVTQFYTEVQWKASIDMLIDVNLNRRKACWVIINIANYTAASAPTGWTTPTTAQIDRWIRLGVVTTYLGQRGATVFEFIADSRDDPFVLDHVYFNQRLGAPLQTEITSTAMKYNPGEPYTRKFQNGLCLANYQATGNLTFVADRDYKDPVTNATYATGANIVLTPNTALMLLTTATGTPNASGPQVTWNSPATAVASTPQTVNVTMTDPDGVAVPGHLFQDGTDLGVMTEIGSGTTTRTFQKTGVVLVDGVPSTLTFSVADTHATPLTTNASKQITYSAPVVLPPPPPPPPPPTLPPPLPGDFAAHVIDDIQPLNFPTE